MMALRQKVALTEEDVAKEKGRVTGRNITNCNYFYWLLEIRARLDAQEKEIKRLEKEKEALSQKYSTDPEIVR